MRQFFLFLSCLFLLSCSDDSFREIAAKGKLTAITRNNNFSYYSYRNEKMGFEYDLIQEFARRNNLELDIIIMNDWQAMVNGISDKKADIIATNMTVTDQLKEQISFTKPHLHDAQVIVINKHNRQIRKGADLNGKTLTISGNKSYIEKSIELSKRYPELEVIIEAALDTEEILEKISKNQTFGTISDSMIYKLNKPFYPSTKDVFPVSRTIDIAWGINQNDTELEEKLNRYLEDIIADGFYRKTYLRYFSALDSFNAFNIWKFKQQYKNRFPRYKNKVMKEAARRGLDWRLIAALMFQESHFNPNARSYRSAKGLMQLMPNTLKMLRVKDKDSVAVNISAGIKYLAWIKKMFPEIPEDQRHYFTVASYNVGPGHIMDAIKLAEEMGLNSKEWINVEKTLALLMKEEYYSKAKYGYCRATETIGYVRNIMVYYEVLKERNQDMLEETPDSVETDEAQDS